MATRGEVARALSDAFLAGTWSEAEMSERGRRLLASEGAWIARLARACVARFAIAPIVSRLRSFIRTNRAFIGGTARAFELRIVRPPLSSPTARPRRAPLLPDAELPSLETPGALAAWLGLAPSHLDWLAALRGGERGAGPGPLRHYHWEIRGKPGGGARVLESPKARLKAIQGRIYRDLLQFIPVHPAAHGFVRRRSALTAARMHSARAVVVRFDLEDFFASIPAPRIFGLFSALGFPEGTAHLLTGLCTTVTPPDVLAAIPPAVDLTASASRRALVARLRRPHLPQGAPSSPALSNLCAYALDARLGAIADAAGAVYTRYADDLAFSLDDAHARGTERLLRSVERVVGDEGFSLRCSKTRIMRRSARQELLGVVVNAHPNLGRDEWDRLKAVIHNCVRNGPEVENRAGHPRFRDHLMGRIAHVASLNPSRGSKLQMLFQKIRWDD